MMGINRIAIKAHAKGVIRASVPSALLVTLVYLVIVNGITWVFSLLSGDPFAEASLLILQGYEPDVVFRYTFSRSGIIVSIFLSILITLFTVVLYNGYQRYIMRLTRGEAAGYSDLFSTFHLAGKLILLDILVSVFTVLWSFLFVIPGIIAGYSYSQAYYILLDNPELSPLECIRRSKRMMRGHKWELFVLQLTFLGWILLLSLPSGILSVLFPLGALATFVSLAVSILCSLWITPYQLCSFVGFYDSIRPEADPSSTRQTPPEDSWNIPNNGDKTDPWN